MMRRLGPLPDHKRPCHPCTSLKHAPVFEMSCAVWSTVRLPPLAHACLANRNGLMTVALLAVASSLLLCVVRDHLRAPQCTIIASRTVT